MANVQFLDELVANLGVNYGDTPISTLLNNPIANVLGTILLIGLGIVLAHCFAPVSNSIIKSLSCFNQHLERMADSNNCIAEKTNKQWLDIPKPPSFSGKPEDVKPFLIACKSYFFHMEENNLSQ